MLTWRHPHQGFTLFELLAVLAITSLLSGIGIVGWQGAQRRLAINATTNQIISMYQATRFQAIRRSTPIAIFLEGDEIVSFALQEGANLNCANVDRTQPIGSTLNWRESLPLGHTVEWDSSGGVIWQPAGLAGSCTGGPPNTSIRITDDSGTQVARLAINVAARIANEPVQN